MFDVQTAGIELDNLSENASNYQDPDTLDMSKVAERGALVSDLVRASGDAQGAATKIFVVLKPQVEALEELLRTCMHAAAPEKIKAGTKK